MNAVDVHLTRARQAVLNAAAVITNTDADGLAAAAIALRAREEPADAAILLEPDSSPFDADAPLPDGPLALIDFSVRELDRPAVFIDDNVPEAAPHGDQIVVCSYGEQPAVPTAALMRRVIPDAPAWLAAVGAVGEIGAAAFALPECADAPQSTVRRLSGLVAAPRCCPDGPVRTALAVLVEHDDPAEALLDPRIAVLEEAKRQWKGEFERALESVPEVGAEVAIVRCASACRIEPLLASTWARRLDDRVVVAANEAGNGRVRFAARGGTGSLPPLLRAALHDLDGELGHGHDRAAGGSIARADLERFLAALTR